MKAKLSRKSQPRNILIANLATSLILHGKIKTTLPKANAVQCYVEKIFTDVRKNSLAAKRKVGSKLKDKKAVAKLFEIGAKNISKIPSSGYTSIYKLYTRKGDGSTIALIKINENIFKVEEDKSDIKTVNKEITNKNEKNKQ